MKRVGQPSLGAPNRLLCKRLLHSMEMDTRFYEEQVRLMILAIEADDSTAVAEALPSLIASQDSVFFAIEMAQSTIGAAAKSAYQTVPSFASLHDTISTLTSDASTYRAAFLLSLLQYLADPGDQMSKPFVIDQGYAALDANMEASEHIGNAVTSLFTTSASPLVRVSACSIADSLEVDKTATISATLVNTGSGTAHDVYVKLKHEDGFMEITDDSVYVGDLASGSEFDVSWQLIPMEAVIDTSDTLGHAWSIMTISPYTSDGLSQSKSLIASVYQGEKVMYGDVSDNAEVTAFDAALILQEVVGLIQLPDPNWPNFTITVADVSGASGITAYDAALILQYAVGLIDRFPVEEGGGGARIALLERAVQFGDLVKLEGDRFALPILIDEMEGIVSGEMEIGFDPSVLRAVEVRPSGPIRDYAFARKIEEGKVRLSFAGAESKRGGGQIIEIIFEAVGGADRMSPIELRKVQFNEGSVAVRTASFIYGLPRAYELAQSYPNPFNLTTTIQFQLPEDAHVALRIYNTLGQEVRTLVDKPMEAGYQRVLWDGRDNSGDEVGTGIYLYQLIAGDFVAIKKAVLLK